MARRDRIRELIAIKERSGRRGGRYPDETDLRELRSAWDSWPGSKDVLASLLPARLVTLIEVFCRYWVQKLIDYGPPYDERAVDLKADVRYDLTLVRSLHGQEITLGLLLSHSIPLSSVDAIASVFKILLDRDFFSWIAEVQDRLSIDHDGEEAAPIIGDLARTKRTLARLFDVRHILVHEFPERLPFEIEEIGGMLSAASVFLNAADEGFSQLLHGLYPINQHDMNLAARAEREAVEQELNRLVDDVAKESGSDSIRRVQEAWRLFAKADASRIAEGWEGGTGYPLVYETAFKVLTSDRLRQLQSELDESREG